MDAQQTIKDFLIQVKDDTVLCAQLQKASAGDIVELAKRRGYEFSEGDLIKALEAAEADDASDDDALLAIVGGPGTVLGEQRAKQRS